MGDWSSLLDGSNPLESLDIAHFTRVDGRPVTKFCLDNSNLSKENRVKPPGCSLEVSGDAYPGFTWFLSVPTVYDADLHSPSI